MNPNDSQINPNNWAMPTAPPTTPGQSDAPEQWPLATTVDRAAAGTYEPGSRQFGPVPNPPAREILPVVVTPRQWYQKLFPLLAMVTAIAVLSAAAAIGLFARFGPGMNQLVSLGGRGSIVGGSNLSLRGEALDVQGVLGVVSPSVVSIETSTEIFSGIFGGAGSGIVIDSEGLILTNAHVIEDADKLDVVFFDGTRAPATLVASIVADDIALIKAEGVTDTLPAVLGTSEQMLVGDQVLAIGNALGLGGDPSVTLGILSAKGRELTADRLNFTNLLQTDAAINPGNSGGPLVNAAGEVIGINTAIIEGSQNVGFAIAIESVEEFLAGHAAGDRSLTLDTAWFGASTQSVNVVHSDAGGQAERPDGGVVSAEVGVYVIDVFAGSAAERAGLEPGDVITKLDGNEVHTPQDVARAIRSKDPGDRLEIEYDRSGTIMSERVSLGSRADADSGN